MKAVMISIRPEWCEKILNGEKTVEIRKTRPKLAPPFKVYIYCTEAQKGWVNLGTGEQLDEKVIAEFTCDWVKEIAPLNHAPGDVEQMACLTREQIVEYCKGHGYAWHISDLKIYDSPKMLKEIHSPFYPSCYNCMSNIPCDSDCEFRFSCLKLLRAPRTWCYVEELSDGL